MKPIEIHSLPHEAQRYPTVGDYEDDVHGTHIRISDMGNEDYEILVAIHEMVEQYLCRKRGISEKKITAFDKKFEREREAGKWTTEEPGDDPRAPYRKEHFFATNIERQIAYELGVDWKEYDRLCAEM
jgi:hypothetical protein